MRQTNKTEVLIELASGEGLDVAAFIERFTDGSAEAAFREDLLMVGIYGVLGFPTFLVRPGEKEVLLRGHQSFEAIRSVIRTASGNSIADSEPESSEDGVLEFINRYGRGAPIEIQTTFGLAPEECGPLIAGLKKDLIRTYPAGNGLFIMPAARPGSCESGVCRTT